MSAVPSTSSTAVVPATPAATPDPAPEPSKLDKRLEKLQQSAVWGRINPHDTPPKEFFGRVIYCVLIIAVTIAFLGIGSIVVADKVGNEYLYAAYPMYARIVLGAFAIAISIWPLIIAVKAKSGLSGLLLAGMAALVWLLMSFWLGFTGSTGYAAWIWQPVVTAGLALVFYAWLAFHIANLRTKNPKQVKAESKEQDAEQTIEGLKPEWSASNARLTAANDALRDARVRATTADEAAKQADDELTEANKVFAASPEATKIKEAEERVANIQKQIEELTADITRFNEAIVTAGANKTEKAVIAKYSELRAEATERKNQLELIELDSAKKQLENLKAFVKHITLAGVALAIAEKKVEDVAQDVLDAGKDLKSAEDAHKQELNSFETIHDPSMETAKQNLADAKADAKKKADKASLKSTGWTLKLILVTIGFWALIPAWQGMALSVFH